MHWCRPQHGSRCDFCPIQCLRLPRLHPNQPATTASCSWTSWLTTYMAAAQWKGRCWSTEQSASEPWCFDWAGTRQVTPLHAPGGVTGQAHMVWHSSVAGGVQWWPRLLLRHGGGTSAHKYGHLDGSQLLPAQVGKPAATCCHPCAGRGSSPKSAATCCSEVSTAWRALLFADTSDWPALSIACSGESAPSISGQCTAPPASICRRAAVVCHRAGSHHHIGAAQAAAQHAGS